MWISVEEEFKGLKERVKKLEEEVSMLRRVERLEEEVRALKSQNVVLKSRKKDSERPKMRGGMICG